MSACWICCHTVWLWCSYVTLICSLTLGTSLAWQCYVGSHQMIDFSTNHLFTELSARVASENLLKTLYVTSFRFRTQTLGLSWLAVTQLSFSQLSSAPSSHTLHFRQSWAGAELRQHYPIGINAQIGNCWSRPPPTGFSSFAICRRPEKYLNDSLYLWKTVGYTNLNPQWIFEPLGETFCYSEHIKAVLLDAIAYQSISPC